MSFSSEIITLIDELAARFGIIIDWSAENIMPYLTDLGTRFITLITGNPYQVYFQQFLCFFFLSLFFVKV